MPSSHEIAVRIVTDEVLTNVVVEIMLKLLMKFNTNISFILQKKN